MLLYITMALASRVSCNTFLGALIAQQAWVAALIRFCLMSELMNAFSSQKIVMSRESTTT